MTHILTVWEFAVTAAAARYRMPREELLGHLAGRTLRLEFEIKGGREGGAITVDDIEVFLVRVADGTVVPRPEVPLTQCADCLCYYPDHEQHLCPYPTSV